MSERGTSIPDKAAASSARIPKGIERMLTDKIGIRFGRFLEYVQPLADLPDPKQDEDAFGEAWKTLEERLEQASAEELIGFVRDRVAHAIAVKQYGKGRELAGFVGMADELRRINQAQFDDIYRRWQSTDDRKVRRAIYDEFEANYLFQNIGDDPKAKELRESSALDDIREVYRFKKKVKSGEALQHTLDILTRFKINLRELDPELFLQVHADAVKEIERIATADKWNTEECTRQARRLIEKYLDLGILDFVEDEVLVDRFTKS